MWIRLERMIMNKKIITCLFSLSSMVLFCAEENNIKMEARGEKRRRPEDCQEWQAKKIKNQGQDDDMMEMSEKDDVTIGAILATSSLTTPKEIVDFLFGFSSQGVIDKEVEIFSFLLRNGTIESCVGRIAQANKELNFWQLRELEENDNLLS